MAVRNVKGREGGYYKELVGGGESSEEEERCLEVEEMQEEDGIFKVERVVEMSMKPCCFG